MKNFNKIIGIFVLLSFLIAVPGGYGNFQTLGNSNSQGMNNNQFATDSNIDSLNMLSNVGVINHLSNSRELVKTPVSHLQASLQDPTLTGPVHIIIGLDGNSLMAEQSQLANAGLSPLNSAQQEAYVSSLKATQSQYVNELKNLGANVIYTYQIVYDGIAAVIDSSNLQKVDQISGITNIYQDASYGPALDTSVPFILGGQSYAQLGVNGSGTTIAIIDTGIDYTHADFGGVGTPQAYANNNPDIVEPGTFPTTKVIGGYDFVGTNYDAGCPAVTPAHGVCSSIPHPDADPLDQYGHGTHVAGIAAGIGTDSVSHGVAPGASLLAIKVFGKEGSVDSAVIIKALEYAVDPNGDGSTSDRADVINLSLGSPYGKTTTAETTAINAAVDAGSIVVAAAGNEGDLPYVTGSPASASEAISVAAGADPSIGDQILKVSGSSGADGDYISTEAAFTPTLKSIGAVSGFTSYAKDACDPITQDLTGQIPLIVRGTCTFQAKITNVQNAGAIGAVVFNNQAGQGPIVMGGDLNSVNIPAVMIGNSDGLKLNSSLTSTTIFNLDPANFAPSPNKIADFSSSGPRFGDSAIKPDITAPGLDIFSAAMGTGTGGISYQGTSMASPHVAGAAALLKAAHPNWTPQEIKSALMNTASDASYLGQQYPVSRMGAGIVHVDKAIATQSVVIPASASFGLEQSSYYGNRVFTQKLQLQNLGTYTKTFKLSSNFVFDSSNDGSIQVYTPSYISVRPGQTASFTVKLVVNFKKTTSTEPLGEYDGFITLKEVKNGGDTLRVPFLIIPLARADASVSLNSYLQYLFGQSSTLSIINHGIRGTTVDVYQFGVWDPNEQLIAGQPSQYDNWFDIQYTGAHLLDFGSLQYLEFAVTTYGNRNVADTMITEILIDVNHDGVPDYDIIALDYGLFFSGTGVPDGNIVSAIQVLSTGDTYLEYLLGNTPNTALQTVGVDFGDINLLSSWYGLPQIDANNPTFSYYVMTTDWDSGASDVTGSAIFNAINPVVDTAPNYFYVDAGQSVPVNVLANGKGSLLFLYYNNVSGFQQAQVVPVGFTFGHHFPH